MSVQNANQTLSHTNTDALINGLFSGVIAGLVMLTFLVASGLLSGGEIIATLERISVPGQPPNPVSNIFLHLGVSAVYGALYGLIVHQIPAGRKTALGRLAVGLVYGMLLYLLAITVLIPGSQSVLAEIPTAVFASAHALYGLVLGWFANP